MEPDAGPPPVRTTQTKPADEKYLKGTWNKLPNYGCPYCDHATPNGPESIEDHIEDFHPDQVDEER